MPIQKNVYYIRRENSDYLYKIDILTGIVRALDGNPIHVILMPCKKPENSCYGDWVALTSVYNLLVEPWVISKKPINEENPDQKHLPWVD